MPIIEQLKPFSRIVILGTTGSGKSTFAKAAGNILSIPIVELDRYMHGPNWTSTPDELFRANVSEAVGGEAWIVDGNYGIARDLIWPRAQAAVWLNYSFPRIFWQLVKRTTYRSLTREVLWNGNTESWRRSFMSRDSILLWAMKSYPEKKKNYPQLLRRPEYAHLAVIEVRHPRDLWGI